MNQPSSQQSAISIGVISLITFFTILLLTSFSILILSGANTDSNLARRTADSVTQYYAADSKAEMRLQQLHEIYLETPENDLQDALTAAGFTPEISDTYDGLLVHYDEPISEQKMLSVTIGLPSNGDSAPQRLSWQTVTFLNL